jgi:hypothetical protein
MLEIISSIRGFLMLMSALTKFTGTAQEIRICLWMVTLQLLDDVFNTQHWCKFE